MGTMIFRLPDLTAGSWAQTTKWLDTLGVTPVTAEEAGDLVLEKIPGAEKEDVRIWEEQEDGRGRYEGEAFSGGLKYEFEIDPQTGRIYDWNADLRE